jgi:muramoyltetrapeptide carboxypeptidase
MAPISNDEALVPFCLRSGDRVRLVSPASTPSEDGVHRCASIFEGWGLRVELGKYVFSKLGYLAGSDEERLADMNEALRDEGVRAIFATRGEAAKVPIGLLIGLILGLPPQTRNS